MNRIPPISSVMTPFPYSIQLDQQLERALELMAKNSIHHLVVKNGDELVGVITVRDVQLALDPALGEHPEAARVRDIQVPAPYIVELTEPLDRVVLHLARERGRCALVVKDGRLAGIFTIADACRSLGELLQTFFPEGGDDQVA
jgi:acetoin utilization protein AcuB